MRIEFFEGERVECVELVRTVEVSISEVLVHLDAFDLDT
jgi:hypothetical protein